MMDIKTSALSLAARAILAGLDAGRWIAARTARLSAAGAVAAGGAVALPADPAAAAVPSQGASFDERVGAVRKGMQERGVTADEARTGGETQMAWRNRWPSTAVGGVRG